MFPHIVTARIRKTKWFASDKAAFTDQLRKDITALVKRAKRARMTPAVRINGTSDLPQLARELASEFPQVQFYDYTKIPRPWIRQTANYHLTFSLSESNSAHAIEVLQMGMNVAAVFNVKRGRALPDTWQGFPVVDGDTHDLRFLDSHRIGLVIGLRAKGRARKDTSSGFVQIANAPLTTARAA